jgi:hypothetical protein
MWPRQPSTPSPPHLSPFVSLFFTSAHVAVKSGILYSQAGVEGRKKTKERERQERREINNKTKQNKHYSSPLSRRSSFPYSLHTLRSIAISSPAATRKAENAKNVSRDWKRWKETKRGDSTSAVHSFTLC